MFGILYIKNYLFYYSSQLFYNFIFFLPKEIYPLCFTPFFFFNYYYFRKAVFWARQAGCLFFLDKKEVGESESERERERERVREG